MVKDWDKIDEVCPTCGQVTKVQRGLTKQNLLKLFRVPNLQDILIFIMLVLFILTVLSYEHEIKPYKDLIEHPQELCDFYFYNVMHGNFGDERIEDFKNFTIIQIENE